MLTPLNRRNFLKWLTATSVALAWPRSTAQTAKGKALVIGAGAAGLAAARILMAEGWEATLLEARDRVGGRVLTDYSFADFPVELGAEFIHGENVVTWDYVGAQALQAVPADIEDKTYFVKDGKLHKRLPWRLALILTTLEGRLWQRSVNAEVDAPLSDLLSQYSASTQHFINHLYASSMAADLQDIGMHGYAEGTYEGDGSTDFWVVEGYSALIQAMAAGLTVHLNHPVKTLAWGDDGVRATTRSGRSFDADACIITLPLAVLQSGSVTFDPALPPSKTEAITRLGAGSVNKIILKFADFPFDTSVTSLFTEGNSQVWWRPGGMSSLDTRHVLTALVAGQVAKRHADMSDDAIIAESLEDLALFAEKPASTLRDQLQDTRVMRWSTDPFSQMGYSYVPVGARGYRTQLAEPIQKTLFFAGEATSVERPSTVHGAMESGIAAAEALMETAPLATG